MNEINQSIARPGLDPNTYSNNISNKGCTSSVQMEYDEDRSSIGLISVETELVAETYFCTNTAIDVL